MKHSSLLLCLVFSACGDHPIDAPGDARVDSPSSCSTGPVIDRAALVDESIAYLRDAFGTTTGFTDGTVAFGEGWVSLGETDCPLADWTTLAYVTSIDPSLVPIELRATHQRVAAVWALNGRKFIAYLSDGDGAAPWATGAMPDNVIAVLRPEANTHEVEKLIAKVEEDHPEVDAVYLDAIGVVTLETRIGTFGDGPLVPTGRVRDIEAAVESLRTSDVFDAFEWGSFVVRIPSELFPAVAVDDPQIAPECLRTLTKAQRDGNLFSSLPSLAAPLGAGPVENANACN